MERRTGSKRPAAAVASVVPTGADALWQRLRDAGVVERRCRRPSDALLEAAALALQRGVHRDDMEALRQLKPHGARVEQLACWMGHLSALEELPVPASKAPKRRLHLADLQWELNDLAAGFSSNGLPMQPWTWPLEHTRKIGSVWRSCATAAAALAHKGQDLLVRACASVEAPLEVNAALKPAALADDVDTYGYLRVSARDAAVRQWMLESALPRRGADLGSPPALARRHVAFEPAPSPTAMEPCAQVWLHSAAAHCACHFDAPDSVLVCLSGHKTVALLPPSAPASLKLPTFGVSQLQRNYDLSGDARFAAGGEFEGVLQTAELAPGHAVYIPHGWWHQIGSEQGTVGLSMPVRVGAVRL